MTYAKAKIWARLIYKKVKTINDVEPEYQSLVKEAYFDIYGEPCPEAD